MSHELHEGTNPILDCAPNARLEEPDSSDPARAAMAEEARAPSAADTVAELPAQFGSLFGCSPAMRRILGLMPRLAATDASLLIVGEPGTGKSALARALHECSHRSSGALVTVDCATIAPAALEAELFGIPPGATAVTRGTARGAYWEADGGTLVLDSIEACPLPLQRVLLRVLEHGFVRPRGDQVAPADVRLLATTTRDLRVAVNNGELRLDLYQRLSMLRIELPPLRERRVDIRYLSTRFHRSLAGENAAGLDAPLLAELEGQDWPGNVHELRHTIERHVRLGLLT